MRDQAILLCYEILIRGQLSLVGDQREPKESAGIGGSSGGKLSAAQFLMVLGDLTTWSLTHFEPVRCWSAAEELTPTEVQEGQGLIGRTGRMFGSDYGENQCTRSLCDVAIPKVRGAALWTAHALMATCHTDASDRTSGTTPQERQHARLSHAAPASRRWLAQRQSHWPREYCGTHWVDVEAMERNYG
jgi:hypothetical protein